MTFCRDCTVLLSAEEACFYGDRCDECQQDWTARIEKWRRGAPDLELDMLYGDAA